MDPNENLREQGLLAAEIQMLHEMAGIQNAEPILERAVRLAELVQALNEWIVRGGALPTAWQPFTRPAFPDLPGGANHPQQFGRMTTVSRWTPDPKK